jgi:hypothetical protein
MFNKELKEAVNFLLDEVYELREGETDDLELMQKISNKVIELEDRIETLEHDLLYFKGKFECSREQSRENLMLLMEYLGVYLDYENDKKVIKKDKVKDQWSIAKKRNKNYKGTI